MKVTSVPKLNYDSAHNKTGLNTMPNLTGKVAKDSVSFGSVAGALKDGTSGIFKWIEKKGFFVEFLIVDTLSMIVPRIWIGLNRDKDKIGHYNYKAGAEEAGRECLSGPSMNLIPMGILALASMAKPSSHMGRETIKGLTYNMDKILEKTKTSEILSKQDQLDRQLADALFDDAFGSSSINKSQLAKLKDKFSNLLIEAKGLKGKDFDNKAKEFNAHIELINNQNKKAPFRADLIDLTTGVGKEDKTTLKGIELIKDFKNYSKDIVEKLSKQNFNKTGFVEDAKKFISKLTTNRLNLKTASALAAFVAVGSFLLYLPKLYQQGGLSPAQESAMRAEGGANENK